MALISCPECRKEISDRSIVCIHCGYPLSDESSNAPQCEAFDVINVGVASNPLNGQNNANAAMVAILEDMFKVYSAPISKISCYERDIFKKVNQPPQALISGVTLENAEYVKSLFSEYCKVEITPCKDNYNNNHIVDEYRAKAEGTIRCPRCKSTSISTGQRGYSFWTGFIGSNTTINRCAKCGYSWKP